MDERTKTGGKYEENGQFVKELKKIRAIRLTGLLDLIDRVF